MIRILDRELRRLLADEDILAELADKKRSGRLGAAWAGRTIDVSEVHELAEHIAGIIRAKSVEPGWWDRSKREMDWYLETEKQRPR